MAISRKPKQASDKTIDDVIEKGGSVPDKDSQSDNFKQKKKSQDILVKVPVNLLKQVDGLVEENLIYSSRSQWIREAMLEKLLRETGQE